MDTNYQNGKIYKILNSVDDEVYVGSTMQRLCSRMAKHRATMSNKPHYKLYQHMSLHGQDKFYIELIEQFPCSTKEELRAKEGEWIRQIGTLNTQIAGRDKNGWYENNREQWLQSQKEYRENNRETIRHKQREHHKNNAETIREKDRERYKQRSQEVKTRVKTWKADNSEYVKEQAQKWRTENKDKKQHMDKEYREKHKEEIKAKRGLKIICDCGCEVCRGGISTHMKTKRHQELMQQMKSSTSDPV